MCVFSGCIIHAGMSGFISFALNEVVSYILSNLYDKCIDFAVIVGYVIVNGKKTKEFWDLYSEKSLLLLKIRNICGDDTVWAIE